MATLTNPGVVTEQHIASYELRNWSYVVVPPDHHEGCYFWLIQDANNGEFDYKGLEGETVRYWISDPLVAFDFKMRFG